MNNTTRVANDYNNQFVKEIMLQDVVYKYYHTPLSKIILDYRGTKQEYDNIKKLEEEMFLWHVSKLKSTFKLNNNILYIYIK